MTRPTLRRWPKPVLFALSIGVSLALLAWLLAKTDPDAVWTAARDADLRLLAFAAVAAIAINALFSADRWRVILANMGASLSIRQIIRIELGCSPIKVFLPLKSGELVKAYAAARLSGQSFERILGTKVMDKYLVGVAMAAILAAGAALAADWPLALLGAATSAAALLLLRPVTWRPLRRIAARLHPRVALFVEQLLSSFDELPNSTVAFLIVHSIIYNLLVVGYLALCFAAVGVTAPLGVLLVNLVLIQLAGLLPFTFAGLGFREGAALLLFAGYGDPAALMAGGLWATVLDQFVFPVAGLFFFPPFLADLLRRRTTDLT